MTPRVILGVEKTRAGLCSRNWIFDSWRYFYITNCRSNLRRKWISRIWSRQWIFRVQSRQRFLGQTQSGLNNYSVSCPSVCVFNQLLWNLECEYIMIVKIYILVKNSNVCTNVIVHAWMMSIMTDDIMFSTNCYEIWNVSI